jgi:putative DNA primase/helicase
MILSNDLPALWDASGAMASRLILIPFPNSFLGKEDIFLEQKLRAELPGILNWAVAGYRSLNKRGHFQQPEKSKELLEEIKKLGSPVLAFVAECYTTGPGKMIRKDVLYSAYKIWCEDEGIKPWDKRWFGRNLRSAVPELMTGKPEFSGVRVPVYEGIGVLEEGADELCVPDDFDDDFDDDDPNNIDAD